MLGNFPDTKNSGRKFFRFAEADNDRTSAIETLDATYKENVKEYALRIPYVAVAGLRSIVDFRGETTAEVKKLALDRMVDNSLLQEIQKETAK